MDAPPRPILGCILLLLAFMAVILMKQSDPYGQEYAAALYALMAGVVLLLLMGAVRLYEIIDKTSLKEAQADCKTVPSIKVATCPEYMVMQKSGTQILCSNRIGDNTYLLGNRTISTSAPLTAVEHSVDLTGFNNLGDNTVKCLADRLDENYKRYSWTERANKCIGVS